LIRFYISLIIFATAIISCNSRTAIVLTNKSNVSRSIRVTYPSNLILSNNKDSLQGWDLTNTEHVNISKERYRYGLKIPISSDTTGSVFFFDLKPKHEVTLLRQPKPISLSTIKKILITAGSDTLNHSKGTGVWYYMVKD